LENREKGGEGLLDKYGGSSNALIKSLYPEHSWELHRFDKVPRGFWDFKNNQRTFMEWLGKQLKLKNMEEWYKVTQQDIESLGGSRLLKCYKSSRPKLLQSVYPDHLWVFWRFEKVPDGTWNELKQWQRVELIKWLENELKIKNYQYWYRISEKHLAQVISLGLFTKFPIEQLLQEAHPDIKWDVARLKYKTIARETQ